MPSRAMAMGELLSLEEGARRPEPSTASWNTPRVFTVSLISTFNNEFQSTAAFRSSAPKALVLAAKVLRSTLDGAGQSYTAGSSKAVPSSARRRLLP